MRIHTHILLACVALACSRGTRAQNTMPPDTFKDVSADHWAYHAMETLRTCGVVVGYPEGYFGAKRILTRYEFAVALDRSLHDAGAGLAGQPTIGADCIATMRRLTQEFKAELSGLGDLPAVIAAGIDGIARHTSSQATESVSPGPNAPARNVPGAALAVPPTGRQLTLEDYGGFGRRGPISLSGSASGPGARAMGLGGATPALGVSAGPLTIGQFAYDLGHVTLWQSAEPAYGAAFQDRAGSYVNGVRLAASFGNVSFEAVGARAQPVGALQGGPGIAQQASGPSPASVANGFRPAGPSVAQPMTAQEIAAVNVGLGFNVLDRAGHLRLSALGVSGTPDPAAASGLGNVLVLGADGEIKLANRVSLTADFSKSLTDTTQQSAPNADANNAFNATLGFGSGGLSVNAGYRYVDPLYYSPGYWGRIGSWVNPTNIQGPTFRAAYDFSNSFGLNVGGEFFSAAHDRSVVGGLNADDDISRLLVGVRWNPVRNLRTTLDWEGVYWSLSGLHNGIYAIGPGAVAHPTENYITLGTGYNFTRNTLFRLDYHFGIWDGHGALNSVGFGQYNFNAVTGQFSVKF